LILWFLTLLEGPEFSAGELYTVSEHWALLAVITMDLEMSRFHRILLIVNPVSGLARGPGVCQRLQRRLQTQGSYCVVRRTAGAGDAAAWSRTAAAEDFDLIVAIGGDGTLQEVVAGQVVAQDRIPIAHVPVGTANVIAIALSLPWSTRLALDVISDGRIVPFDVGYLPDQDRHFLLMAAIGYPARIIQDSPRRLKKAFGFLAYVFAAVRNAFLPDRTRLQIETDDELHAVDAHTVLVTNIGRIKELGLKISPDTSPHDGRFDVSTFSSRTVWDVCQILFRILTWRRRSTGKLQHFQASRVRVGADPPLPVQIDGEVLGTTPLVAEILPGAVQIVVPAGYRQT
jgi:YegS/Rv2252/BmrU family lipid kinase